MKKKNKWIKYGVIMAAVLIVGIVLILLCPSVQDLRGNVPQDFYKEDAKKSGEVAHDWKIFSTLVVTQQINSNQANRYYCLGIAGQKFGAYMDENTKLGFGEKIVRFMVNCTSWIPNLLKGAEITILLTICSVTVGVFLSIFLALGKMSKIKPLKALCDGYVFLFRGTPLLMQLFFIYYGLPLINPSFAINDRFTAAWIAFGLNSAAYCAEIIRAGIQSIDKGQFEAAKALGFSYGKTMRKIIIPQTYRRLIPPIANEFIMVLKDASLTSIIALQDLSKVTQSIMTSTNDVSIYLPSMLIYLLITGVFTKIFGKLEEKFSIYE